MPDPRREALKQCLAAHGFQRWTPCESCHHNHVRCLDQLLDELCALFPPVSERAALEKILDSYEAPRDQYLWGRAKREFCDRLMAWAGQGPSTCPTCQQPVRPGSDQP